MAPVERLKVEISPDLLVATLEVFQPAPDSEPLTRAELEEAIVAAGVVHGVLAERLDEILAVCARGELLPAPLRIAKGLRPRPGREGKLELKRPLSSAGRVSPEGDKLDQIDHRERGGVTSVEAGELFGVLHRAVPGKPGVGVDGSKLVPEPVAESELVPGANVEQRERAGGKLDLVATMEGILQEGDDGRLSVTDKIEIPGDVDYATGNIEARGSVVVKGVVRSSFRLTATRDVEVGLSIEDAIVEVGGNLKVGKSILGGDEGHVHVGGTLVVRNTQNARVQCKGDIILEGSDTGSVIECEGRLTAVAGRGRLSGGTYTAVGGLEARELGSTIGAPTLIRVGISAADREELTAFGSGLAELAEQVAETRLRLEEVREAVSQGDVTPKRARKLRKLMKDLGELTSKEAEFAQLRQAVIDRTAGSPAPEVLVHGTVHTGVDLQLRDLERRIETHREGARYFYNAQNRSIDVEDL